MTMMTEEESRTWRPEVKGWADDILPFYKSIAPTLPANAVIVELGVARGRSLIFLAEEITASGSTRAELFGVDHMAEDYRDDLEANIESASEGARTIIELVEEKTVAAAELFDDRVLDMVFVDADHGYEGCKADLEAWGPKVKPGGILAGHDYSETDFPGVVRAVDEYAKAHGMTVERPTRSVWRLR